MIDELWSKLFEATRRADLDQLSFWVSTFRGVLNKDRVLGVHGALLAVECPVCFGLGELIPWGRPVPCGLCSGTGRPNWDELYDWSIPRVEASVAFWLLAYPNEFTPKAKRESESDRYRHVVLTAAQGRLSRSTPTVGGLGSLKHVVLNLDFCTRHGAVCVACCARHGPGASFGRYLSVIEPPTHCALCPACGGRSLVPDHPECPVALDELLQLRAIIRVSPSRHTDGCATEGAPVVDAYHGRQKLKQLLADKDNWNFPVQPVVGSTVHRATEAALLARREAFELHVQGLERAALSGVPRRAPERVPDSPRDTSETACTERTARFKLNLLNR